MRYVLVVQSEKVSAFAVGRSEFSRPVLFLNGQLGQQQLSEYLRERRDSLFTIVLDSKDEEHHQELIPVLKRGDQKKVLNRLQKQYFPSRVLCAVSVQNRKLVAGQKVSVTISGISDQNDCAHWLALFKNESTLVTEIYSLSLLGASLPAVSSTGVSLCAVQLGSNEFRLLAYESARLLISRHVTLAGDLVSELNMQLSQTLRYIESISIPGESRLDAESERVDPDDTSHGDQQANVSVIGHLPEEAGSVLVGANINVYRWDCAVHQASVKFSGTLSGSADFFAMLCLRKQSRKALLKSGHYGFHHVSRRVKHLLLAGSVCCLGVTIASAAATTHYSQTYESLAEFTQFLKSDSLKPLPYSFSVEESEYPIDAVRDSLRLSKQLDAEALFTPLHFLTALATDLTVYPELQVTSIKWERKAMAESADMQRSAHLEMSSPPLFSGLETGGNYTAIIEGYVRGGEAKTLSFSGRFNSFIAALKATNRYSSVTVMDSPFALSRESFVSDRTMPDGKPRFLIELINRDVVQ